jgi:hypothetical protein
MTGLAPFPVDDFHLDQLEHATRAGSGYPLTEYLHDLSHYDEALVVPVDEWQEFREVQLVEYQGGPVYHPHDVIRALIGEVRRLRGEQP